MILFITIYWWHAFLRYSIIIFPICTYKIVFCTFRIQTIRLCLTRPACFIMANDIILIWWFLYNLAAICRIYASIKFIISVMLPWCALIIAVGITLIIGRTITSYLIIAHDFIFFAILSVCLFTIVLVLTSQALGFLFINPIGALVSECFTAIIIICTVCSYWSSTNYFIMMAFFVFKCVALLIIHTFIASWFSIYDPICTLVIHIIITNWFIFGAILA